MKRSIATLQTWWVRLFVLSILVSFVLDVPQPWGLLAYVTTLVLFLVRPPRSEHAPVELAAPVRGRWVALNSPGSAVPSHGVKAYGQAYAVDLLQPSEGAPAKVGWSLRTRAPQSYRSFGAPVFAMADGTVAVASDWRRDHRARDTWPSILWMMTFEGLIREVAGVGWIMGNHVIVQHDDGTFAAYAHLRRGSLAVTTGDRVVVGQPLAAVGNTGNTSEPHLHVQLMDRGRPTAAAGIPMHWPDLDIDPGDTDERWGTGEPKATALAGFPGNGQVFTA